MIRTKISHVHSPGTLYIHHLFDSKDVEVNFSSRMMPEFEGLFELRILKISKWFDYAFKMYRLNKIIF